MENPEKGKRFFDEARETMDWEERESDLSIRFLKTFEHAFRHSKAYREIFDSAGIELPDIKDLEDLEKLPVLSMDDLVERQKRDVPFGGFETVDHDRIRRIYVNPGLIWQPGEWEFLDTSWAEALCGLGFNSGDRILNTFNYHMWPIAFMLDASVKMIGATVIPTGVGNTLMQVKIMQTLKVNGFMGTPSFIMTLIQRAEGMGLDLKKDLSFETALVGAEMLSESLRSRIEDKLKMTVRQVYGTAFLGCIGYECMHMTGLHVPDNVIVEVVDPNTGKQVQPGTTGEIVVTTFNTTYPMIRMATGDLSMLTRESCECGRTGPMLKKIFGRIDQATKVRGTFVHPWQADEVLSRYPEVFKYQVVITREDDKDVMTFVVELVEETDRSELIRGRIERDIKDILTVKGAVQIVPRGTIPDLHKKIEDKRTWE
ncbi:MAG: AMP-binding protein [Deltaproteobacteria bacterium]|nr:AMP-binding protein [Deltaproteobacteria bacterium]MBW2118554.1 AMP-binding protein [Deltaproteobacteria bacterium]MBW2342925.1 AMP-binding protein [Deltaproteobacteria bacterium]